MVISETFENDFDSGNDFNSRTQYGNSYSRLVRKLNFIYQKKSYNFFFRNNQGSDSSFNQRQFETDYETVFQRDEYDDEFQNQRYKKKISRTFLK